MHLLTNPHARSGRGAASGRAVAAAVVARGHHLVHLRPDGAAGVAQALEQALREGMSRLVVAGGDGLIHHALPPIARSGVTLGIVPSGTGNDFARALGLPTRFDAAVDAAVGPAGPVDLMVTEGGHWAASVVTGGFSGAVNARANQLRFPRGQQRYTVATLLELGRLRPVEVKFDFDGTVEEHRSSLFAIGNTRYFGGGMAICPDADPDDGLLDVTIVGPTTRFELARMLPTVFSGRHIDHPAVTTRRVRSVGVATSTPLWADGEAFRPAHCGANVQVVPGALQVAGILITP